MTCSVDYNKNNSTSSYWLIKFLNISTAWKVSVFGAILVRIFPHSDQNNPEYGQVLRRPQLEERSIESYNQEVATKRCFCVIYWKYKLEITSYLDTFHGVLWKGVCRFKLLRAFLRIFVMFVNKEVCGIVHKWQHWPWVLHSDYYWVIKVLIASIYRLVAYGFHSQQINNFLTLRRVKLFTTT